MWAGFPLDMNFLLAFPTNDWLRLFANLFGLRSTPIEVGTCANSVQIHLRRFCQVAYRCLIRRLTQWAMPRSGSSAGTELPMSLPSLCFTTLLHTDMHHRRSLSRQ